MLTFEPFKEHIKFLKKHWPKLKAFGPEHFKALADAKSSSRKFSTKPVPGLKITKCGAIICDIASNRILTVSSAAGGTDGTQACKYGFPKGNLEPKDEALATKIVANSTKIVANSTKIVANSTKIGGNLTNICTPVQYRHLTHAVAASREIFEETGIIVPAVHLIRVPWTYSGSHIYFFVLMVPQSIHKLTKALALGLNTAPEISPKSPKKTESPKNDKSLDGEIKLETSASNESNFFNADFSPEEPRQASKLSSLAPPYIPSYKESNSGSLDTSAMHNHMSSVIFQYNDKKEIPTETSLLMDFGLYIDDADRKSVVDSSLLLPSSLSLPPSSPQMPVKLSPESRALAKENMEPIIQFPADILLNKKRENDEIAAYRWEPIDKEYSKNFYTAVYTMAARFIMSQLHFAKK
jgi:8-oxo-dGTP pyrophosphatase MutT (NUDIX family)